MTEPTEYSFMLPPKTKRRHVAGKYDYEKKEPRYEIEASIPEHVRHQLDVKHVLIGSPQSCQWGWDLDNKSSWPAFVTIKENGILIKNS